MAGKSAPPPPGTPHRSDSDDEDDFYQASRSLSVTPKPAFKPGMQNHRQGATGENIVTAFLSRTNVHLTPADLTKLIETNARVEQDRIKLSHECMDSSVRVKCDAKAKLADKYNQLSRNRISFQTEKRKEEMRLSHKQYQDGIILENNQRRETIDREEGKLSRMHNMEKSNIRLRASMGSDSLGDYIKEQDRNQRAGFEHHWKLFGATVAAIVAFAVLYRFCMS